jgi:hemerythrin
MPIFWRPQLAIGHDDIDSDHRYLILLINTVELVLRFPESPENILLAFEELEHYARWHFEREEKIQVAHGYPYFDQHWAEHQKLLETLAGLRRKVEQTVEESAGNPEALSAQSAEVTKFLRGWLINHVLKSDTRMIPLFKRHRVP